MVLLEREEPLALLETALVRADGGEGRSILIGGEAGIGKTALLESFVRSQADRVPVLWGVCEALTTPRPLGPLYDIAHALGGRLLRALDADRSPHRLFNAFMDELRGASRATIVVVEDAHWADDASVDFLKFVGRRIARYPALLVVTFREDEVAPGHPLLRAMSDVPADHLSRIRLRGLSAAAIDELARAHTRVIPNLHAISNGNPFLATEMLRGHGDELYASLRDTMLSRFERLPPAARELAALVSVVPDRTERDLLDRAWGPDPLLLQQCIDTGILIADDEHVRYRHELSRRAAEDTLTESALRALHARVVNALPADPTDIRMLSRIVHHADAAGDASRVVRYAPLAGDEAARRGAHQQGAAFYRTALRYAEFIAPRQRAGILEKLASECRLSGLGNEALDANARAFEIWGREEDTFAQGANRRARFEMLHISLYRRGEAEFSDLGELAVKLLETHGATGELANAYMNLAFVRTMAGQLGQAQACHERAVATAEMAGDRAALCHVLLQGELRKHAFFGEPDFDTTERVLNLALEDAEDQRAAHAYFCAAMFCTTSVRLTEAEQAIADGLRFAEERDLDGTSQQLLAFSARVAVIRGNWEHAKTVATGILSRAEVPGIAKLNAEMALGTCWCREGDSRGAAFLERAFELATNGIVTRIARVLTLGRLAELAWLVGDDARARMAARHAAEESMFMQAHPWLRGQGAFWQWRTEGTVAGSVEGLAPPYAMQFAGDWRGAAAAWGTLGCPYERAMALIDGDPAAQREAIAILDRLGATATIRRCLAMLAGRGVTRIPRGPRPSTRANPMGLTDREIDVLKLLSQGLPNAEMSRRLHRSVKTVANHVSAILDKLGAATRRDAIAIARARGLLDGAPPPK